MKKTLLAAIIASELPKPCITLDLFKSEDRLRAYGGIRCPGRVTLRMNYQQFTDAAHKMSHNEKVMVWMDEATEFSEAEWIRIGQIPIMDDIKNLCPEAWRKEGEK